MFRSNRMGKIGNRIPSRRPKKNDFSPIEGESYLGVFAGVYSEKKAKSLQARGKKGKRE